MHRRTVRRWAQASVLAATLIAPFLSGCGGDDEPTAVDTSDSVVDELAAHDGKACPDTLPPAADGVTADQPATTVPELPAIEEAWVCQYSPTDAQVGSDGSGSPFDWALEGERHPVDAGLVKDLEASLAELAPPAESQLCTADLGPRFMLAYAAEGGDLTGVVVDDFGCQGAQLTDEPFETVPGAASGDGLVPGILIAPAGLLDQLKAVAG